MTFLTLKSQKTCLYSLFVVNKARVKSTISWRFIVCHTNNIYKLSTRMDEKLYSVADSICMREYKNRLKTSNDDDLNSVINFWHELGCKHDKKLWQ